jgi:hypothetical protein
MAIYPVHGYVKGLLGMKLVYNQLRKEIRRRKLGLEESFRNPEGIATGAVVMPAPGTPARAGVPGVVPGIHGNRRKPYRQPVMVGPDPRAARARGLKANRPFRN